MGWLAVACVCGFLGYWVWRTLSNWLVQRYQLSADSAGIIVAIGACTVLFAGMLLWAIEQLGRQTLREDVAAPRFDRIVLQSRQTFENVVALLYHGQVARFLFGVLLGVGAAFVISQRTDDIAPDGTAKPRVLPMHLVLSMGIGILALAVTAPYIDGWFHRLTGIKSPLIELQLGGPTTHRVSVAAGQSILFYIHSLKYLQSYPERIQSDIEYFEKQGKDKKKILESARNLLPTFEKVIKPVATCLQKAIEDGWLSIESARQELRPTADLLEQIIFGEGVLDRNGGLETKHKEFWRSLTEVPAKIRLRIDSSQCAFAIPQDRRLYPKFQDYENLPYFHAAAALFIGFMGEGDKALEVLQRANDLRNSNRQPVLDFKDYTFWFALGRLSYYQGRPGDIIYSYFGPLNEMRAAARSRIDDLRPKEKCGSDRGPICFAQIYEVVATNLIAYYLAEDLARGNDYAKNYTARLRECRDEIKHVLDDMKGHSAQDNAFYAYVIDDKLGLLDTYAYATLVLEAEKPHFDDDLIRTDVIDVLKQVVEHREENLLKKGSEIDVTEIAQLRISQAHLQSAREFLSE